MTIGSSLNMKVLSSNGDQIQLGIDAPKEIPAHPEKLSSLHQCVVYLRVSRELDTASIALTLQITLDEVLRLENEARQYLQAIHGFDIPIDSPTRDFEC